MKLHIPKTLFIFFVSQFFISFSDASSDFWFYKYYEAPAIKKAYEPLQQEEIFSEKNQDHYWFVTEFFKDPFHSQLETLKSLQGFKRATLVFHTPPAPTLGPDYASLIRTWRQRGVEGQFKFVNSLPTVPEMLALKEACELGTKIIFYTKLIPTYSEARNLQELKSCVQIHFTMNRYFFQNELNNLVRLSGLPVAVYVQSYPSRGHVAILNQIKTPLSLHVQDVLPTASQTEILKELTTLISIFNHISHSPTPTQYHSLQDLKETLKNRIVFQWTSQGFSDSDFIAWNSMNLDQIQAPVGIIRDPRAHEKLRQFSGGVVLVGFFIKSFELNP